MVQGEMICRNVLFVDQIGDQVRHGRSRYVTVAAKNITQRIQHRKIGGTDRGQGMKPRQDRLADIVMVLGIIIISILSVVLTLFWR
jgi:hypothetical protein